MRDEDLEGNIQIDLLGLCVYKFIGPAELTSVFGPRLIYSAL